MAECDRLQPGESVASAGAAAADWELVADEPAAAFGEDRRFRLVKHARYYGLLLAEGHLTRRLFGAMLRGLNCCRCQRDRPAPEGAEFEDGGGTSVANMGRKRVVSSLRGLRRVQTDPARSRKRGDEQA